MAELGHESGTEPRSPALFTLAILKPKRSAPVSLRGLGYIRATPDVCIDSGTTLHAGDKRSFASDFPRTDLIFDGRKEMRLGFRVVAMSGFQKEPLERFYYP